jgi:hypothetical protein
MYTILSKSKAKGQLPYSIEYVVCWRYEPLLKLESSVCTDVDEALDSTLRLKIRGQSYNKELWQVRQKHGTFPSLHSKTKNYQGKYSLNDAMIGRRLFV